MCYTFYDKKKLPEGSRVGYIWDFGDGTKAYTPEYNKCYTGAGEYRISLSLYDSTTNFLTENSSVLDLKIEPSSKYYFNYKTLQDNDLDVAFLDADNSQEVKSENMYWKIGSEVIYDHDHLTFHPEYGGQYAIKGYLKEKNDIICITDTFIIEGTKKSNDKNTFIHLVYKKTGKQLPDELKEQIILNMLDHSNQENYTLFVPKSVSEEWKNMVRNEFRLEIGKEIKIEANRKSMDLLLKIYE